jgi:hypothetical protein
VQHRRWREQLGALRAALALGDPGD